MQYVSALTAGNSCGNMSKRSPTALWVLVCVGVSCVWLHASDLAPPVKIQAGNKPIDVKEVGHAAPFVADLDGDGLKDLLVGQFRDGRLRIFRNLGTKAQPRFDRFTWFMDGAEDGRVPYG
jgi:hypothetical protein